VDAARAALASGTADHALERLRRYRDKYPAGIFRPEAAALKIEALVKLGRSTEARSLAERFLVEQGDTPLADRVAHLTGLAHP
jgi:outer membrane protein assembly factor BamD (BamD/ComL family)